MFFQFQHQILRFGGHVEKDQRTGETKDNVAGTKPLINTKQFDRKSSGRPEDWTVSIIEKCPCRHQNNDEYHKNKYHGGSHLLALAAGRGKDQQENRPCEAKGEPRQENRCRNATQHHDKFCHWVQVQPEFSTIG